MKQIFSCLERVKQPLFFFFTLKEIAQELHTTEKYKADRAVCHAAVHLITAMAEEASRAGEGASGSRLAWRTHTAVRATLARTVVTCQGTIGSEESREASYSKKPHWRLAYTLYLQWVHVTNHVSMNGQYSSS